MVESVEARTFSRHWLWVPAFVSWDEFPSGVWQYVFSRQFVCTFFSAALADHTQYDGQEGVELGIKILRQELKITMALAG